MVWLSGYPKFLTQILVVWCIAVALLEPAFASDRGLESSHTASIASTRLPCVDLSDTAIGQTTHQLTRANLQFKTLLSVATLQSGIRPQFARTISLAEQFVVSKSCSLLDLGIALRL